jgi:hypothetical protein
MHTQMSLMMTLVLWTKVNRTGVRSIPFDSVAVLEEPGNQKSLGTRLVLEYIKLQQHSLSTLPSAGKIHSFLEKFRSHNTNDTLFIGKVLIPPTQSGHSTVATS